MSAAKDALYALVRAELESALDPREQRRRGRDGLSELAQDATDFAALRLPEQARVRVARPLGQRAGRTTVEILAADQPFIVDTVRLTLRRLGLRELVLLHPLLALERESDGSVAAFGRDAVGRTRESYVYAELTALDDPSLCEQLTRELERALADARHVVADHAPMLERLREHVGRIETCAPNLPGGFERARGLAEMLRWLGSEGFLFMGYRRYTVRREADAWRVSLEPSSALGILCDVLDSRFAEPDASAPVPPLVVARLDDERVFFFDKTRSDSTVHRRGRLDSVSVKLLDENANVVGFARFVGLLTNRAMRTRPSSLAVLATRRARVIEALGTEPGSHTHKLALEAYDCLPLEFLLPAPNADATRVVSEIVAAAERGQTRVVSVSDVENRSFFVSVVLPRRCYEERFGGEIDRLLESRYRARHIDHRSSFLDEDLALVHFFCACDEEVAPDALVALEVEVRALVERWQDRFEEVLAEHVPGQRALQLAESYAGAFPDSYRLLTSPAEAVLDVVHLERLRSGESRVELGLDFATEYGDAHTHRLKIYLTERPYLTDVLPVVQRFGVRVVDATLTEVTIPAPSPLWIVSFRIEPMADAGSQPGDVEARVLDGLRAALSGRVDSDELNRLVLEAGLDWRSVDVLRAYLEYARQIGHAPPGTLASDACLRHPASTRALVAVFRARFDPDLESPRPPAIALALRALADARAPIASAAEDRVFGGLESLISATLRTSFFRPASPEAPHELAFKLDSRAIPGLRPPVPLVEIFVHSPELLGVHLRGGRVARGGLRFSDRLQDLRTEILSLWKTQRVKNGLIVPVGAKGGFALKRPPSDPRDARAEADRLYARFVAALLRLTDDVRGERIVAPERVVRHDADDPYLVIAADKGTAHLSDVANRVASEAGFWLGDAFASGGSNGYDHKKCAITARGAWLCARRHFAELGRDPERETYRVAGIGDMSGDVFGNGLLLMRRAKLVAAFDHRHVFLDPDPDPEIAWLERKRLFELPRSSWADYARDKLSAGGGVHERGAKQIALSKPVQRALATAETALSGEELIRAILRAPVDLLWNGGIGTYVKASSEPHEAAGDRANDGVRVDARELRAGIVVEGGNLGLTQAARVELARAGVRLDTDAIHNSSGVDLSDHEVNYKILLAGGVADGSLDASARNQVLRACLDVAAEDVLSHNVSQSVCLSLDALRAGESPERIADAADFLVRHAELDARLEGLPDRAALVARVESGGASSAWTRPELAILLGYTKLLSKRSLASSSLLEHTALAPLLRGYFPTKLRDAFPRAVESHRLRREITALALVNRVIDHAGVTLVPELARTIGTEPADVIAAWWSADELLEGEALRADADASAASESDRLRARLRIEDAVREAAALELGLERRALYAPDELAQRREHLAELRERIVPAGLELETLPRLVRSLGVLVAALRTHAPLARALELWAELGERTRIAWLLDRLACVERPDAWSRVGAASIALDMTRVLCELCERELTSGGAGRGTRDSELDAQIAGIARVSTEIEAGERGLAPLLVLSQRIRRLC
ncbi:MAG: NAD-glutamate dehydrogenase domain-containing protein [Myxococcota bacterium]